MVKTAKTASPVQISLPQLVGLRAGAGVVKGPKSPATATRGGGHRSRFRGRGMEFAEVRAYQPGDDVRNIDWRVTARRGTAHTKLFHEERERPVLFALDYRRPMFFATRGCFKAVLASQLAAVLAWGALAQGDRIGGFLFSEEGHIELRPAGGRRGVLRLLQGMVSDPVWNRPAHVPFDPHRRLAETIQRLARVVRPGSRIHLFSDFTQWDDDVEKHLALLSRQADVALYFLFDALEVELPGYGNYRLSDGERDLTIATDQARTRREFHQAFKAHRARLEVFCRNRGLLFVPVATDSDPLQVLQNGRSGHGGN